MRYLLLALAGIVAGCDSAPDQAGPEPAEYRVQASGHGSVQYLENGELKSAFFEDYGDDEHVISFERDPGAVLYVSATSSLSDAPITLELWRGGQLAQRVSRSHRAAGEMGTRGVSLLIREDAARIKISGSSCHRTGAFAFDDGTGWREIQYTTPGDGTREDVEAIIEGAKEEIRMRMQSADVGECRFAKAALSLEFAPDRWVDFFSVVFSDEDVAGAQLAWEATASVP